MCEAAGGGGGQGGCVMAFQEEALDLTQSLKGQEERKGISSAENTFCGGGYRAPLS